MRLSIEKSLPSGVVKAPPSKSDAHRLLICAGLSKGKSVISDMAFSEDIKATIRCLEAIGCSVLINNNTAVIEGIEDFSSAGKKILDCSESGSTLRFFIPICLLSGRKVTLTGSRKLLSRPLGVYKEICDSQNIEMQISDSEITLDGRLSADTFTVKGNVSSQFISGLLFALPLLKEQSTIKIIPPFESRPYVDMTIGTMARFGVKAEFEDEYTIKINGAQSYEAISASVEGDWSNAAFFYAYKESGADIEITGTDENSLQGDRVCADYFRRLKKGFCTLDLSDCPDLAPILFAFAAKHNGAEFTGTDRLRLKESDRIAAMDTELLKFGGGMDVGDNRVTLKKCELKAPAEAINGHNDHRIVMSMAYLLSFTGGTIEGYEAVSKSFPDFFTILENAGVKISYEA